MSECSSEKCSIGKNQNRDNDFLALRGYRCVTFCPVCLRPTLSNKETRILANLINNCLLEEAEVYLSARGLRLFMLEPEGEARQLLNRRVVVGAVCKSHRQVDLERIEHVCVLASKYGQVTKETL